VLDVADVRHAPRARTVLHREGGPLASHGTGGAAGEGAVMLHVFRVLAPNPGPFTLEGTNTWVVGRGPAAVIDPGPDEPGHVRAVARAAGAVGAILVTHGHPEHGPGAAQLAD